MNAIWECVCCDCPLFHYLFPSKEENEATQPLLEEEKKRKVYYKEPLLVARIARENSAGDWDKLHSLQTPTHWNRSQVDRGTTLADVNILQEPEPRVRFNTYKSDSKRKKDNFVKFDSDIDGDDESNCDSDEEVTKTRSQMKISRKKNSITRVSEGIRPILKTNSTASVSAFTETGSECNSPQMTSKYKGKSFSHLFSLGDQIGLGSTATVYKCRRKKELSASRGYFAVKVIDKKKLINFGKRKRQRVNLLQQFRQEIQILDTLRHPHIIRIFGMFESNLTLHVVIELCEGGELFDFLTSQEDGCFAGKKELIAKRIVFQVASAVSYMHSEGIIHRDIKLENILLQEKVSVEQCLQNVDKIKCKIIDFGLAKVAMKTATLNDRLSGRAKTFFGTVGYLAPEMFGGKSYNNGVDVWALGVLTYVLFCGNFPFNDTAVAKNLQKQKQHLKRRYRIKYPSRVRRLIPEKAKFFMSRLLEPDAESRITSQQALEMAWLEE